MTTRVEVSGTDRIAKTRQEGSKKFWIWAVAIVIGIALIVTTSVIALPDARSESNNRSFDAAAARYQGLADLHAKQAIAQQRNWEATAARYQALADEYISLNVNPLNAYWSATAARYQALADDFGAKQEALERYWSATAARYQALADAQLAEEATGIQVGWAATGARYQALADDYATRQLAAERYWSATAARYQALADAQLAEEASGIQAGWAATAARYKALADHYMANNP
jgi:hypothetical protein